MANEPSPGPSGQASSRLLRQNPPTRSQSSEHLSYDEEPRDISDDGLGSGDDYDGAKAKDDTDSSTSGSADEDDLEEEETDRKGKRPLKKKPPPKKAQMEKKNPPFKVKPGKAPKGKGKGGKKN